MNVFEKLKLYARRKNWKLLYDAEGKAFLYNIKQKVFKDITLYPQEQFRPPFSNNGVHDNFEENYQKWLSTFDNVQIYSEQIGEGMIDGIKKPLIRYGFIGENGYIITHATYERVQAFQNGRALVYLNNDWCQIDLKGNLFFHTRCVPLDITEFAFAEDEDGFSICSTEGKYGLINKYQYLCLPCKYEKIELLYGGLPLGTNTHRPTHFAVMNKEGRNYTAIINGSSVCNILDFKPKFLELRGDYLLIKEERKINNEIKLMQGLLNRGGIRILNSDYDSIDVVADFIAIVSKNNLKNLLFIGQSGYKSKISNCRNILYGEAYDAEEQRKYYYASINEDNIQIVAIEDQNGNREIMNWTFCPDDLEDYKIYFTYDGEPNNYFAIVVGDKTKLISIKGDEMIPLVIPSDCHVITNTFNEGIVGISKNIKRENEKGETYEETYYSYINSEGKILTDFIYDKIEKFKNGQAKAFFSIWGESSYGCCEQILDNNGNVLYERTDWDGEEPNHDWVDMIDDAFEGDSDAYWNID